MKTDPENSNITSRHIYAAQTIWKMGTFARAAEVLGVVPSALTETIRQIETAIGATIFDRSQRPPRPTALGLRFLQETAPLIEGMHQAMRRARAEAGLETGRLCIGAAPSAISDLIAPVLAVFRARVPQIRCRIHDDIAERLGDLLRDGTLDLAIAGRARPRPDISQQLISRDRFGLALAAGHPLAGRQRIRLADLDPAEVIALDPSTGTSQLLADCDEVSEALCHGGLEAHSTIAQLAMIRAGLGVVLMPENAVRLFGDPKIVFLPLQDLTLTRENYLLLPTRRPPTPACTAFVAVLHQHLAAV